MRGRAALHLNNTLCSSFRIIRLEFNHQRLHYYTEIDAVLMIGRKLHFNNMQYLLNYYERQQQQQQCQQLHNHHNLLPHPVAEPLQKGERDTFLPLLQFICLRLNVLYSQTGSSILGKLHSMHFRPLVVTRDNYEARLQQFLQHDLDKFLATVVLKQQQTVSFIAEKEEKSSTDQRNAAGRRDSVGLRDMPVRRGEEE